jgi:putative transposase
MTRKNSNRTTSEIKAMMAEDDGFLRPIVRTVIQEFLEAEMTEAIGAQKGERVEGGSGYRSGYYPRSLITRVGKLELRVPQDRNGRFSTEIFERYQRSEKAMFGRSSPLQPIPSKSSRSA